MRSFFMKLKKRTAGFTLAETLICVLILLMVSAIVGAAIPTAANVYTKTVDAANAQVLLSTAITVLRDELGTASSVNASGTEVTYNNGEKGPSIIKLGTDADGITSIWIYYGYQGEAYESDSNKADTSKYNGYRKIVSDKAATEGMILKYTSVTDDDKGVVTVTGLTVSKKDSNGVENTLAGPQTVVVRAIGNND